MPLISKETWELIPESERKALIDYYEDIAEGAIFEEGKISAFQHIFGEEALQPKPLTYEDVARELFMDGAFLPHSLSVAETDEETYPLNCISDKQTEKLLAINRLLNVARFLNGKDWKPDWSNNEDKWTLCVDPDTNKVRTIKVYHSEVNRYIVYFRTEQLIQQAIQILGEDTVRLAFDSSY